MTLPRPPHTSRERLQRLAAIVESAITGIESAPPSPEPSERREVSLRTARLLAAADIEIDDLLAAAVIDAANNGATWAAIASKVGYLSAGANRRWRNVDRDSPQGTRHLRVEPAPVVPRVLHELGLDGQDHGSSSVRPPSSGPEL